MPPDEMVGSFFEQQTATSVGFELPAGQSGVVAGE
tara:strand:+ start:92 stop:196 length:105 start_codon:yes stop_codon:yes gene_type:complete